MPRRSLVGVLAGLLSILGAISTGGIAQGSAAPKPLGYGIVTSRGAMATFGGARFDGDLGTTSVRSPIIGAAATRDHDGYWMANAQGVVHAFGNAPPARPRIIDRPVVAIVADPTTSGFWLVAATGFAADWRAPNLTATPPISDAIVRAGGAVAASAVPNGAGLWVLAADGSVFGIGQTPDVAGPSGLGPEVGIASTADGAGYWVANENGVVHAFGDATPFAQGNAVGSVVSIVATPDGGGYLLVSSDGAVEAFGDATNEGDAVSPLHPPTYPAFYQAPATEAWGAVFLAPGRQAASSGPLRITFVGDSVSVLTAKYTADYLATHHADAVIDDGGIMGCGVVGNLWLSTYSNPTPPAPTLAACADWAQQYRQAIAVSHPNVVVVLLGYWESQRHRFGKTTYATLANCAGYAHYLRSNLTQLARIVQQSGARLVFLSTPPFGDHTPERDVNAFNALVRSVARSSGAADFNLATLLNPAHTFERVVDATTARGADLVHPTRAGIERLVDPTLVPDLLNQARNERTHLVS